MASMQNSEYMIDTYFHPLLPIPSKAAKKPSVESTVKNSLQL